MREKFSPKVEQRCGEILYEDGKAIATCSQPWGTEHSHHDHTASRAIALGLAVRYMKEERITPVA